MHQILSREHRYLNLAEKNKIKFQELFDLMILNENDSKENYVKLDRENLSSLDCKIVYSDIELDGHPGKHDGKTVDVIIKEYKSVL